MAGKAAAGRSEPRLWGSGGPRGAWAARETPGGRGKFHDPPPVGPVHGAPPTRTARCPLREDSVFFFPTLGPEFYEEVRRFVQYTEDDSRRLRESWPFVEPHLDRIADVFYSRILANERARRMLQSGETTVGQLRESLKGWLRDVFVETHDRAYYDRHAGIGRRHVRLRVGQAYILMAMNVLRRQLFEILRGAPGVAPEGTARMVESLSKALDIELSIIFESYREEWVEELRRGAKLGQIGRLASVGEMAAVMSHELGNSLAGISGALQLLARDPDVPDRTRSVFDAIFERIRRSETFLRDLLMFSKPITPSFEVRSVRGFLERSVLTLREHPALQKVEIQVLPQPEGLSIRTDEYYLQQALGNVVINGAQAMGGEGRIRIGARENGSRVEIFAEDEGSGVSEEVLDRCFDPFFTTKSHGSGLGLSNCYRILQAHGGDVHLENLASGTGARAILSVPIARVS